MSFPRPLYALSRVTDSILRLAEFLAQDQTLTQARKDGSAALHCAQTADIFKLLIRADAKANTRNVLRKTSLHNVANEWLWHKDGDTYLLNLHAHVETVIEGSSHLYRRVINNNIPLDSIGTNTFNILAITRNPLQVINKPITTISCLDYRYALQ